MLVLSGKDVYELLTLRECIDAVQEGFRLHAAGRTLGPMTVRGYMASWPETNPPLTPGQGYVARLKTADGKRTLDFEFSVAEPGAPSDAAAILRID